MLDELSEKLAKIGWSLVPKKINHVEYYAFRNQKGEEQPVEYVSGHIMVNNGSDNDTFMASFDLAQCDIEESVEGRYQSITVKSWKARNVFISFYNFDEKK